MRSLASRPSSLWIFFAFIAVWIALVTLTPTAGSAQDGNKDAKQDKKAADKDSNKSSDQNGKKDSDANKAGASDTEKKAAEEGDESTTEGGTGSDKPASKISKLSDEERWEQVTWPLIVLGIGIAVVLGLIIGFKVNAFIALITAAIVVSLCAPGGIESKISRVASSFGSSAGGIGIVIGLAAVIGQCLLESGAADRIVRTFVSAMGEKRSPIALMGSGFVLAVPVFFDTVFYLLVPLARSLYRRTNRNYLLYILAIAAGGAITHSLVPPTPGPLLMASNLNIDIGFMIMIGALVALPSAIAGLIFSVIIDKIMPLPMRTSSDRPEPEPLSDDELPSLALSLLPVLLPVALISTNTVLTTLADAENAARLSVADVKDWDGLRTEVTTAADAEPASVGKQVYNALPSPVQDLMRQQSDLSDDEKQQIVSSLNEELADKQLFTKDSVLGVRLSSTAESLFGKDKERMKKVLVERMNRGILESAYPDLIAEHVWDTPKRNAANVSALLGNANLALLISTIIAILLVVKQRNLTRDETAKIVEQSLMSGGVIILITAGGGAFGAMLKAAQIGGSIQLLFEDVLSAEGSSVMLLTLAFALAAVLKVAQGSSTVAMIVGSSMMAAIIDPEQLTFHPVYLATAIGSGSLIGSWMNDSGFWIFAKMGGLTEPEALKSWTFMLIVLGAVGFGSSLLLSNVLPLI